MKLPIEHLKDPNVPASVLMFLVFRSYGLEAIQWEPELLRKELEEDFNITLTDLQSDKLQAAFVICASDSFEQDWKAFETIIHLLNNQYADLDTVTPVEAEQIALALPEIELIRGWDDDGVVFSDEVQAYCGRIFHDYGMVVAPHIMPSAIMPESQGDASGDKEKNEALDELYAARKAFLNEELESLREFYQEAPPG